MVFQSNKAFLKFFGFVLRISLHLFAHFSKWCSPKHMAWLINFLKVSQFRIESLVHSDTMLLKCSQCHILEEEIKSGFDSYKLKLKTSLDATCYRWLEWGLNVNTTITALALLKWKHNLILSKWLPWKLDRLPHRCHTTPPHTPQAAA